MKEEYWETKNGSKIAVGDMDEKHVRNTLRLLIRKIAEENLDQNDIMQDLNHCDDDFYKWR